MKSNLFCRSVFQAIGLGAVLGFAAALTYGCVYAIYGILRISMLILKNPPNHLAFTLAANAVSIFLGAAFFAMLCGLLAALIQAITLGGLYGLSRAFNRQRSPLRGAMIGLAVSALIMLAVQLLFHSGPTIMLQVFMGQSYLIWFGLPTLIYLALTAWTGWTVQFGREAIQTI